MKEAEVPVILTQNMITYIEMIVKEYNEPDLDIKLFRDMQEGILARLKEAKANRKAEIRHFVVKPYARRRKRYCDACGEVIPYGKKPIILTSIYNNKTWVIGRLCAKHENA